MVNAISDRRFLPGRFDVFRPRGIPWAGIGATASLYAPWPLRLLTGIGFMYHGYPKLFDATEHAGFRGMLGGLGVPFPEAAAWLVGGLEFFGGFALLLGALTGLVGLLLIINMGVAALLVHAGNGFGALHQVGMGPDGPTFAKPGVELPLLYAAMLAALVLMGPGPLSIDAWLARRRTMDAGTQRERRSGTT